MAYTLYIHEPLQDLPELAQYGFPTGSFFSTDLEWVVEDALFEAAEEGVPQVVIMVEAPDDVLTVHEGDIQEALSPTVDVEDEWEEVPEEEGEFLEAEEQGEFIEEEEFFEEAPATEFEEPTEESFEEEEAGEEEADWPTTLAEAIELTDSATLAKCLDPQTATVLGEAVEFVQEELTPEESAAGMWYGFTMEPTPLIEFLASYVRRALKRLFRSR